MYQSIENLSIQRHFVNLGSRQVHYRMSGSGPVLIILHQSPTSSAEMASVIEGLSNEFTVIAPDTPGFGLSDFIDGIEADISQYAEALKEFLDALEINKACFYGFHTGAIIATEIARLYPELCNAVVVNGLVVLEPEEETDILKHYTKWFEPTPEGSQMSWIWSRIRDQLIFFPWFKKELGNKMSIDLPSPEFLQPYILDLLRSNEASQTAYQAAFLYPSREHIRALEVPTFLINHEGDPIADHPRRLSNLPNNVVIELLPDPVAVEERSREIFKKYSSNKDYIHNNTSDRLQSGKQGFAPTTHGPIYYSVEGNNIDNIVLFLHDLGQSSREELFHSIRIKDSLKLFVDLPGHGETGPTHLTNYSPQSIVRMLAEVLDYLGLSKLTIISVGASLPIALRLSEQKSLTIDNLVLIDPWCLSELEKEKYIENYVPDITPSQYGEHLMRSWYFARDSELFFPWFEAKSSTALNRMPDIKAESVHNKAVEILKAGPTLKLVAKDLIGYDIREDLENFSQQLTIFIWQGNLREIFAERISNQLDDVKINYLPEDKNDWLIEF